MAIVRRRADGTIAPGPHRDIDERFWEKVHLEDAAFPENGCMIWTGAKGSGGYGKFGNGSQVVKAIRWIYERLRGPIPQGHHLHHLCRRADCVNPDHVQPLTRQNHAALGPFNPWQRHLTHCKHGHEFTPGNTYSYLRNGTLRRACRICRQENKRRYRKRISHGT